MHPVQKHLFDTEFSGLDGTEVEGTLALSDELINLGLMEILAKIKAAGASKVANPAPPAPTDNQKQATAEASLNPQQMLKKLRVDKLQYRTEKGKTVVDFKAGFGDQA